MPWTDHAPYHTSPSWAADSQEGVSLSPHTWPGRRVSLVEGIRRRSEEGTLSSTTPGAGRERPPQLDQGSEEGPRGQVRMSFLCPSEQLCSPHFTFSVYM